MEKVPTQKNVIIMGGSITGLLAARIMSDHFEKVTVIEKDVPGNEPEPRKGVPQGRHVHILLKGGEQVLEELFPGIIDQLRDNGSRSFDWGEGVNWFHHGVWKLKRKLDWKVSLQSRPFLEAEVRRRVAEIGNVSFLFGKQVEGLLSTSDGGKVTGVRYRCRGSSEAPVNLDADLVIDATGRNTQMPEWLGELGYRRPPESRLRIQLAYTTRVYKVTKDPGFEVLGVYSSAPETALGYIFRIEDGKMLATQAGYLGNSPPTRSDEWVEFSRGLPQQDFYQTISEHEPISGVKIFRFENQRRHYYERMKHHPEGLLVMGDAIASFDPVFGQGMSVAARQAKVLQNTMHRVKKIEGLYRKFYKGVARVLEVPWLLTTLEAYRFDKVEGVRPPGFKLFRWYVEQVYRLSGSNPLVYKTFLEVMHLVKGPQALVRPGVLFAIIKSAIRGDQGEAIGSHVTAQHRST